MGRFWLNLHRWHTLAAGLRRRVRKNLHKFRVVAKLAGRLLIMHAHSVHRVYAPGGVGFAAAFTEFSALADPNRPTQQLDHHGVASTASTGAEFAAVELDAMGGNPPFHVPAGTAEQEEG